MQLVILAILTCPVPAGYLDPIFDMPAFHWRTDNAGWVVELTLS